LEYKDDFIIIPDRLPREYSSEIDLTKEVKSEPFKIPTLEDLKNLLGDK